MNAHFIIVENTRSTTAAAGTHAYYGPFPTLIAAQSVLDDHPRADSMEIVPLDHLAPVLDPFAMHPASSGV